MAHSHTSSNLYPEMSEETAGYLGEEDFENENIEVQPDLMTDDDCDEEIYLVSGLTDEDGAPILPQEENETVLHPRNSKDPSLSSKLKSVARGRPKTKSSGEVDLEPLVVSLWGGEGSADAKPGSDGKAKRFACTFCEYRARWKANVENHVKTVHLGIREFKIECPECDYKCKYASQLKQHVLAVHDRVKPFSCNLCEYTCSQKSSLNLHTREVHQQLRRYSCDVCHFRCGNRYGLKKHLQQKHGREQLLTCYHTDCKFMSSDLVVFEAHEASHLTSDQSSKGSTIFVGSQIAEQHSEIWDF